MVEYEFSEKYVEIKGSMVFLVIRIDNKLGEKSYSFDNRRSFHESMIEAYECAEASGNLVHPTGDPEEDLSNVQQFMEVLFGVLSELTPSEVVKVTRTQTSFLVSRENFVAEIAAEDLNNIGDNINDKN